MKRTVVSFYKKLHFTGTIIDAVLIMVMFLSLTIIYFTPSIKANMKFSAILHLQNGYTVIELKDNQNGCTAQIYSLGAILNAFSVPTHGGTINVINGFESVETAKQTIDSAFQGAKLSPFVCRMRKGEYHLNNRLFKVEKFYLGEHAIHGLLFDAAYEVLNTHADEHNASVGLRYLYKGTDKGYPFSYEILVNWKLEADNRLSVRTTVLHHNPQAIPFADGWHPYFNLGDSINHCSLQFDAEQQLEFDSDLLPTGKAIEDARFNRPTTIGDIFLDNCFILNQPGKSKCVFQNNNIRLTIHPDQHYPYLQVYTPPNRKSIAIENLSAAPDAFNNKIGLLLLEPNHSYSFTTTYQLTAL